MGSLLFATVFTSHIYFVCNVNFKHVKADDRIQCELFGYLVQSVNKKYIVYNKLTKLMPAANELLIYHENQCQQMICNLYQLQNPGMHGVAKHLFTLSIQCPWQIKMLSNITCVNYIAILWSCKFFLENSADQKPTFFHSLHSITPLQHKAKSAFYSITDITSN